MEAAGGSLLCAAEKGIANAATNATTTKYFKILDDIKHMVRPPSFIDAIQGRMSSLITAL